MIKRFTFTAEPAGLSWGDDLPGGGRCLRVARNTVLPGLAGGVWWNTVIEEWFEDSPASALEDSPAPAFEASILSSLSSLSSPPSPPEQATRGLITARGVVVLAAELVLRGAPWLGRRLRDGGGRLKHMAVATRAAGLTPAGFAERWRSHAGTAGGTRIPDAARGQAYVQNHPLPRPPGAGEWPYDAVNEVYFDDEAGLRERVEWFRASVPSPADGVLFGQSWLIAVREVIL